jgi:PAS domain S-box-containing protein
MNFNEPEPGLNNVEISNNTAEPDNLAESFQKELSFRKAIENSIPSGIAVIDEKGRQVYANQSFCRMLGWNEDELLYQVPPYVYWSMQDIENIESAFRQTLNNNAPKEGFDLVFTHKNGTLIPVNVIISPFRQEESGTFYLANVIDISERKKSEEALKKYQLFLESSIESQKDMIIFSVDKDYNYLYFNKAHRDAMLFAYNKNIKPGLNFLDFVSSDDDRILLKDNVDRALRGESHSLIQTFGKANLAYYEVFFNPIVNETGEIIAVSGLARNITERMQAQQSLKDSETKFKEIINQINDAIVVFDDKGKIIIWNRGAEQIYGFKAKDVLDKDILDIQIQLIPPPYNDRSVIEKAIDGIITQKTPEIFNQIIDSEIIRSDSGKLRNIQSMVFPIKLNGDYLFCSVIRDTTEIKRYEKELIRISSEKDKFYSIIAQYLYTPFNVFNNFSKLMAEELDSLPIKEIQKMAGMMSKSASNLYGLLDNLLQWTRMNQGKIPFMPHKMNLKKVSHDAISVLKPDDESKDFKINYFINEDIIVFADIYMLKTILRNLVSCVLKFSGNDVQIDISARQTTEQILISVLENKNGISSEHLKNLFDISQIHTAIGAAEEKGMTLGLLLCKEFVEKHGGKIWVESKNDNGAEFTFTLPLISGKNSLCTLKFKPLNYRYYCIIIE